LRRQTFDPAADAHRATWVVAGLYWIGLRAAVESRNKPGMHRQVFTIARFTLIEALRTRLALIAVTVIGLAWLASVFVQHLALTESARLQASVFASSARLASVFILTLYITSSVVREFNEKGLELVLALDVPRSSYVAGKLAGFIVLGIALAILAAIPLLYSVPLAVVAVWSTSLALELAIVGAASLFCIVTFAQVLPAVTLVAGFYLLSRVVNAMRLMAESSVLGGLSEVRPALNYGVELIAYVVPQLDRFSATQWIADRSVDSEVLAPLVLQSAVYVALLLAASLFDLYRKEL
jgi:ABC-type transport system involved in multi-copper enzyme maturation permease subunit